MLKSMYFLLVFRGLVMVLGVLSDSKCPSTFAGLDSYTVKDECVPKTWDSRNVYSKCYNGIKDPESYGTTPCSITWAWASASSFSNRLCVFAKYSGEVIFSVNNSSSTIGNSTIPDDYTLSTQSLLSCIRTFIWGKSKITPFELYSKSFRDLNNEAGRKMREQLDFNKAKVEVLKEVINTPNNFGKVQALINKEYDTENMVLQLEAHALGLRNKYKIQFDWSFIENGPNEFNQWIYMRAFSLENVNDKTLNWNCKDSSSPYIAWKYIRDIGLLTRDCYPDIYDSQGDTSCHAFPSCPDSIEYQEFNCDVDDDIDPWKDLKKRQVLTVDQLRRSLIQVFWKSRGLTFNKRGSISTVGASKTVLKSSNTLFKASETVEISPATPTDRSENHSFLTLLNEKLHRKPSLPSISQLNDSTLPATSTVMPAKPTVIPARPTDKLQTSRNDEAILKRLMEKFVHLTEESVCLKPRFHFSPDVTDLPFIDLLGLDPVRIKASNIHSSSKVFTGSADEAPINEKAIQKAILTGGSVSACFSSKGLAYWEKSNTSIPELYCKVKGEFEFSECGKIIGWGEKKNIKEEESETEVQSLKYWIVQRFLKDKDAFQAIHVYHRGLEKDKNEWGMSCGIELTSMWGDPSEESIMAYKSRPLTTDNIESIFKEASEGFELEEDTESNGKYVSASETLMPKVTKYIKASATISSALVVDDNKSTNIALQYNNSEITNHTLNITPEELSSTQSFISLKETLELYNVSSIVNDTSHDGSSLVPPVGSKPHNFTLHLDNEDEGEESILSIVTSDTTLQLDKTIGTSNLHLATGGEESLTLSSILYSNNSIDSTKTSLILDEGTQSDIAISDTSIDSTFKLASPTIPNRRHEPLISHILELESELCVFIEDRQKLFNEIDKI